MAALLESPPRTLSMADLVALSPTLAEQVSRFPLDRDGFTVADYLSIASGPCVEYVNGSLQVLPMPDAFHQALISILLKALESWSLPDALARTMFSPFPVYLTPVVYREPDVCFMLGRHASRRHRTHWDGADLVIEIISKSNRDHDETTKRIEYAAAGIPEYWIVDPEPRTVRVLTLTTTTGPREYGVHGDFEMGQTITSPLLAGLAIDVADLFAAAERRL